ncbi:hypothetical protein C8J57DRAFT_1496868 [Mycena rebaudengoi]|nr:hypothetical protein C8J57DRAFT_1496868 [Mycena rebaudengoi]
MFFSAAFLTTALVAFCGVAAVPQPETHALVERGSSPPCILGTYLSSTGSTCLECPRGSFCTGGTAKPQLCAAGTYAPYVCTSKCLDAAPGHFQPNKGATEQFPCAAGSYQPYGGKDFCYGAPSGRFQSLTGQSKVCGTCCGWAAPLKNNNKVPVKCTGSTPNAWPASGDGCINKPTDCVRAATCSQQSDGSCPADTFRG